MTLVVRRCGSMVTLQDRGRRGRAHEGIARAGAFDQRAASLANRLVGNDPDAAVLEVLLGSCAFDVVDPTTVAITGAVLPVRVNGMDASQNHAIELRRGDRLELGIPSDGLRAYLALSGGVDAPLVLGSRSYDSLGRIGAPPLAVGDVVRPGPSAPGEAWFELVPVRPHPAVPTIDILEGPRYDWLSAQARVDLTCGSWVVEPASDRTGVRLRGEVLTRATEWAGRELATEAMIPGAIQLPSNGQPIILGPDCGTTGGYPVVGVVWERSMSDLAQLRPGQHVRLRLR